MRFFTAIIIMFSYLELYSQQIKVINDFGINLGVIVEKKLSKKHILQIEQQLRLYNNALKIDDYVFDFGYNYIINKKFKIGGNLRYTYNKKRWKNFENDYRYNLDFYYKLKVTKKSKFQYRLRYQHKYTNLFYEYKTKKINKSTFRNRLKYSYRLNKKK